MERSDVAFWGALAMFVVAFILSGILPHLALDKVDLEFQTLEDLARDVPEEFYQLEKAYPEEFKKHYGVADSASYAKALRDGRDAYIAEACWHCHSQYVRPVANEDKRWGAVSEPEEYNNALHMPPLWGTRRTGPDLTRQKGLHTNGWHMAHLFNPKATSPGSVMPRYPWFFEGEPGKERPGKRAIAMVAYLQWIGTTRSQVDKKRALEKEKGPLIKPNPLAVSTEKK